MRRAVLIRSIQRIVGADVTVYEAAYLWRRHPHMVYFTLAAFVALLVVAISAGYDDWPGRIVIGAAGAAIAVAATTNYRIVATTSQGLLLFSSSRIRQYARELIETMPPDTDIELVGGTVFATDWKIGKHTYTVPKSSEQAIQRIASR